MRHPRLPRLRNFRAYDRTRLMCDVRNLLSAVTIELGNSDGNKTSISFTNRYIASLHAYPFFHVYNKSWFLSCVTTRKQGEKKKKS